MEWEIESFVGMGPLRFGMQPHETSAILGPPDNTRKGIRSGAFSEFRAVQKPILRYREGSLSEIEAFYDVPNVSFRGIRIFEERGIDVLRKLEIMNGSALISVGIVLFGNLGISVGRLDEKVREQHSITAFAQGLWDEKMRKFENISFL